MKLDIIKNELKDHIGDFVQKEAKETFLLWLKDEALPAVKEIAAIYNAELAKSSETETGWSAKTARITLATPTLAHHARRDSSRFISSLPLP